MEIGYHPASFLPPPEERKPEHYLEAIEKIGKAKVDWVPFDGLELPYHYFRPSDENPSLSDFRMALWRACLKPLTVYWSSITQNFDDFVGDLHEVCENSKALGVETFVGECRNEWDDIDALAQSLNQTAEIVTGTYDFPFAIHTHTEQKLHQQMDGKLALDNLFELTDESVGFCPDTAQLYRDGIDLVEIFERYARRIRAVHFKNIRDGDFIELDNGEIEEGTFRALMEILESASYTGPVICDMDYIKDAQTPERCCERNLRFLLGLEKGSRSSSW